MHEELARTHAELDHEHELHLMDQKQVKQLTEQLKQPKQTTKEIIQLKMTTKITKKKPPKNGGSSGSKRD